MKKLLAMALAVIMTCGVMTACGSDDSSEKKETTTTTAAETTTTTTAAETTTTTTTTAEPEPEGPAPIEDVVALLANKDKASITFTADSDISYISMFNEERGGVLPGDEGYNGDEAILNFSIEEVAGIPMLKIDEELYMQNEDGSYKHQGFKVRFDMNKLFEGQEEKLPQIFSIKADVIAIASDPASVTNEETGETVEMMVPAWNGGAFGTNNNGSWNGNLSDWSVNEFTNEWAYTEILCRPGIDGENGDKAFNPDFETNYLTFMCWAQSHDVDLYIANVVFEDADGNLITLD